jgi:hypothetical protein
MVETEVLHLSLVLPLPILQLAVEAAVREVLVSVTMALVVAEDLVVQAVACFLREEPVLLVLTVVPVLVQLLVPVVEVAEAEVWAKPVLMLLPELPISGLGVMESIIQHLLELPSEKVAGLVLEAQGETITELAPLD